MGSIEKPDTEKFLLGIIHSLLDDLIQSNGRKNTEADKATVLHRYMNEGLSFLTKTLPLIGKAVEFGLETGIFLCPTNFARHKKSALPKFLKGLLSRIFDVNGNVLTDVDAYAIAEVRQVSTALYKLKMPFSASDLRVAEIKFKEVDYNLPWRIVPDGSEKTHIIYDNEDVAVRASTSLDHTDTRILNKAREFITELFKGFDPWFIHPAHGPGIVASGESPHEKRVHSTFYRGINNVYPYWRNFYVNHSHFIACIDYYLDCNRKEVGTNKVLFVPKDSRGPRTIACEPLEYQYVQQGLRKLLYQRLECHPLTSGRINFTDQTVNQKLAELGSVEPWICTVDMKDASDSVSMALVEYLFRDTRLLTYLRGTRTPCSLLPSGEVVNLKKYAAMGSALCFPIEAVVFYAIIQGVYSQYEHLYPFSYVYGDDLVLDREILPKLTDIFHAVGLKVNVNKTYSQGLFRESCGKDYYNGTEITGIKVRNGLDDSPESIVSLVETANQMFDNGYYKCGKFIERSLRNVLNVPFGKINSPYVCYSSQRWPEIPYTGPTLWNKNLQIATRKVPFAKGATYESKGNGLVQIYGEYLRKQLSGWSEDFRSGRYAKRHTIKIIRRYIHVGA